MQSKVGSWSKLVQNPLIPENEFGVSMSNPEDRLIQTKISRVLPDQREDIFRLMMQVELFPEFMPNVKKCQVLEKGEHNAVIDWSVEVDGIPFSWKEKTEFDLEQFSIRFKAIEGDLSKLDGQWFLKPHPKGTEVTIELQAAVGIPVLDQMISSTLKEKIDRNFTLMLEFLHNRIVSNRYLNFQKSGHGKIDGFAIIGHPYNFNNLLRYLKGLAPEFNPPSREFLMKLYELVPSYVMYDIKKLISASGAESHGLVVVSTFIPDMVRLDERLVFDKVVEACRVAENHHIGIAALGGFTSIVGERFGAELRRQVNIPLTTGNTFTVSLALDGIKKACELMEVNLHESTVCIVGGTGDIGGGCAKILAEEAKHVIVTGRVKEKVDEIVNTLKGINGSKVTGSIDNVEAVKQADVIIAAASVTNSIMQPNQFKSGAIICDLAYPKNISYTPLHRDDIFVFSGGLTQIPMDVNLGFEIGLPSPRTLYGCFAEAILLDLEKRYENFSYGKGNITRQMVLEIKRISEKHGFYLSPFYWGDRVLSLKDIEKIKHACRSKATR
jgi:fatty aldehyde-generating acyl-ACP reductase